MKHLKEGEFEQVRLYRWFACQMWFGESKKEGEHNGR
jgi:hypothetical protein